MEVLVGPNLIAPRMCDEGSCVCTTYTDVCVGDIDIGGGDGPCECKGVNIDIECCEGIFG